MRKKTRVSKTLPKWIAPTAEPKFKIGDRVELVTRSTAIPKGTSGTVHGVIYKPHEGFSGYWYDVNFDGFLANHTIAQAILREVQK